MMTTRAEIIDGKAFAAKVRDTLADKVKELSDYTGIRPGLAVVLVGDDPASQVYVRNKIKFADEIGMTSFAHFPAADINDEELTLLIEGLNNDETVHGILVQLPLPVTLDEEKLIEAIAVDKDVDGFHPINRGRFVTSGKGIIPCTPLGSLKLLQDHFGPDGLTGKSAVVVGRSNIVGKPMAQLLMNEDCTVTVAHRKTKDLAAVCREAEILVVAAGRPGLIRGDWIKPGAVVIDVGMNRIPKSGGGTRLVGDVVFEEAVTVASAITPVPGGVGPMTIAMLLRNTLVACVKQNNHVTKDFDLTGI